MNTSRDGLSPGSDDRLLYGLPPILRVRRHWVLVAAQLALSIPPLLLVIATVVPAAENMTARHGMEWLVAGMGLLALWITMLFVRWYSVRMTLTPRTLVLEAGVVNRAETLITLDGVQAVKCRQSILGRVLDYGLLEIGLVGDRRLERFGPVGHPRQLRQQIVAARSLLLEGWR